MSAFAAIAYPDRVELIADGAIIDSEGRLAWTTEKLWASAETSLAFSARGNAGACTLTWLEIERIARCGSFDETLLRFQEILSAGLTSIKGSEIDAVIAGISETHGPCLRYFTTSPAVKDTEPFQLHDTGRFCSAGPEPTPKAFERYGFPDRLANESLAECGADLMEASRRTTMNHNDRDICAVGGHVDLAVVRLDGARIERLRTWPDEVGKVITS